MLCRLTFGAVKTRRPLEERGRLQVAVRRGILRTRASVPDPRHRGSDNLYVRYM